MKRWQYLTFQEQMIIRTGKVKPLRKKKVKKKKKLNIDAIKVTLLPQQEKLFSGKDWVEKIKSLRYQK